MRLNELYARYKDQVQFFIVYLREAHPAEGWQVPNNLIEDILYNRVQGDVGSYSIAGRQLSKMPPSDLITLRDFFKRQVGTEERKERIRQDKGTGANILGGFRR